MKIILNFFELVIYLWTCVGYRWKWRVL